MYFVAHTGVVKAEQKNFSEAVGLFSQALQLDPNHEAARRHLEQARLQLRSAANSSNHKPTPSDSVHRR